MHEKVKGGENEGEEHDKAVSKAPLGNDEATNVISIC